jgi:hypothetical protein
MVVSGLFGLVAWAGVAAREALDLFGAEPPGPAAAEALNAIDHLTRLSA